VAYALLGFALLLEGRRSWGLALLALATAMRHNAFTLTLPLVVCVWYSPAARLRSLAQATGAWIAITAIALLTNRVLADRNDHVWERTAAILDVAGTLRYAPPIEDAELRTRLDGIPMRFKDGIQDRVIERYKPGWLMDEIWRADSPFESPPIETAPRVVPVWRDIVTSYPGAFLQYRTDVMHDVLGLPPATTGTAVYAWFLDVQLPGWNEKLDHEATPSSVQRLLSPLTVRLGRGILFRAYPYLIVVVLLLPFCARDRIYLALAASALLVELGLYAVAPATDFRYSLWLAVVAVVSLARLVGARLWPRR
jgi:hypothetical protein